MKSDPSITVAERIVLWLLWCVFCAALIFYRTFLVNEAHNTSSLEFPATAFGLLQYSIPLAVSLGARWLVVPRLRVPFLTLVPFLIGIATAEMLTFFGIFLSQKSFSMFFYTTVILMLMWIPIWRNNVEPAHAPEPSQSSGR